MSDPSYLPLQGQLYGSTGYEYERITREEDGFQGVKFYSAVQAQQLLFQSLEYGITDDITVAASGNYIPRDKRDEDSGPDAVAEYHFQGLDDPDFTLTWRALDERTHPVNLDLSVSYSPDWVGNRYATFVSSGTVGRGGDATGASAAVSYKTRSFTMQAVGGAYYYGSAHYEVPDEGPQQGDNDPYWEYFAGLLTQTRLTDRFSIDAGYHFSTFSRESTTEPGGLAYSTSYGNENNLDAALNYHIIPNRLVAGVTYNYIVHGATGNAYEFPAFDTTLKNQQENIFGVRLQYVFF